ncbi:MAG: ATP synthase subunit C [Anaerolineae bacterium]|jgi:V/A-type H+-transporting ATPase subunit K|nr:ATP synthase subunit C [Anaerolineae bacterium]
MNIFIFGILVAMIPMIPAVIYFMRVGDNAPQQATQRLIFGLKAFNVIVGLMAAGIGILWLATPSTVSAAVLGADAVTAGDPYTALGAAISTGLAAIGAGVAVSGTGSAAVGAIAEKPESFGRALIFVGLAEGIAIYGLIISFMILNR